MTIGELSTADGNRIMKMTTTKPINNELLQDVRNHITKEKATPLCNQEFKISPVTSKINYYDAEKASKIKIYF